MQWVVGNKQGKPSKEKLFVCTFILMISLCRKKYFYEPIVKIVVIQVIVRVVINQNGRNDPAEEKNRQK